MTTKPDSLLIRLVTASVNFADAAETLSTLVAKGQFAGWTAYDAINHADEKLREAALAYTRSLSSADRNRIARRR